MTILSARGQQMRDGVQLEVEASLGVEIRAYPKVPKRGRPRGRGTRGNEPLISSPDLDLTVSRGNVTDAAPASGQAHQTTRFEPRGGGAWR